MTTGSRARGVGFLTRIQPAVSFDTRDVVATVSLALIPVSCGRGPVVAASVVLDCILVSTVTAALKNTVSTTTARKDIPRMSRLCFARIPIEMDSEPRSYCGA